uniref:G-protein coupled receptors family 1 profile domain-containing protein n=1 Tax=Scophthalmus maximus TaxID=52904 RepID=A0A8D2ZHB2_SCOMX
MPYQLLFPIHVSTSHHSDFSFLSKTFVAFMDIDPHAHLLHLRNFTYFSFFSELRRSDHAAATVVETLAISTVFLVSVAANAGAAALVTWERRLLANKTVLTLNLFAADLLFISMIPLIVAVRWTVSWTLGFAACHTVLYVICMSGSVTITTLRVPTLNPRMVTATLIFIWAFSALTALPLSLFFTVVELDFPEQVLWPDSSGEIVWNISFTALCFLLPGFIIVVSYSKILQVGFITLSNWQTYQEYHVSRQDMKLFRTLLVLVLSFLLMWSPIFINTFLILARNFFGRLHVSSTTFFWVITFTLTNSALNPILYSVFQFKSGLRKLCCSSAVVPLRRATRGSGRTQRTQP